MHAIYAVGRRAALGLALCALPASVTSGAAQYGVASWYGEFHHGLPMANGRPFDMEGRSAAHRSLPLGTTVRVTNLLTGRSDTVVIEDRGPYVQGRIIDVSKATARRLRMLDMGIAPVRLEVVGHAPPA